METPCHRKHTLSVCRSGGIYLGADIAHPAVTFFVLRLELMGGVNYGYAHEPFRFSLGFQAI
jgi:hypothetical protein